MRIGPLFHWSPTGRRLSILTSGLVPAKPPTVATTELSYVCLGFSPSGAWALSGGSLDNPAPEWDLWQVQLADRDSVTVRPEFGSLMCEVMVHNLIPAERLWWVGTRPGNAR